MGRRLVTITSLVSLLLCIAWVVVGATGGWVDHSRRFHPLIGRWEFSTDGHYAGIQIVLIHAWQTPIVGPVVTPNQGSPQFAVFGKRFPPYVPMQWHGGFGYEYGPIVSINAAGQANVPGTRRWVSIPYRAPAILFLILPVLRFGLVPLVRRLRFGPTPPPRGICRKCGYDLTANASGVCPECGTIVDELSSVTRI